MENDRHYRHFRHLLAGVAPVPVVNQPSLPSPASSGGVAVWEPEPGPPATCPEATNPLANPVAAAVEPDHGPADADEEPFPPEPEIMPDPRRPVWLTVDRGRIVKVRRLAEAPPEAIAWCQEGDSCWKPIRRPKEHTHDAAADPGQRVYQALRRKWPR